MLSLKHSARLLGVNPILLGPVSTIVNEAYRMFNYDAVVTSGIDGRHSVGSLHNSGNAIDFRMNHIPKGLKHGDSRVREIITVDIRKRLTDDFDVILEEFADNPDNDHLHIEFQPKKGY